LAPKKKLVSVINSELKSVKHELAIQVFSMQGEFRFDWDWKRKWTASSHTEIAYQIKFNRRKSAYIVKVELETELRILLHTNTSWTSRLNFGREIFDQTNQNLVCLALIERLRYEEQERKTLIPIYSFYGYAWMSFNHHACLLLTKWHDTIQRFGTYYESISLSWYIRTTFATINKKNWALNQNFSLSTITIPSISSD